MGKRNHKHFYIVDTHNFGRCKCGATKQFPGDWPEGKIKIAELPKYDPDSWLRAVAHIEEEI